MIASCEGFHRELCLEKAYEESNPKILGEDVTNLIGNIKLDRVLQLFEGKEVSNIIDEQIDKIL